MAKSPFLLKINKIPRIYAPRMLLERGEGDPRTAAENRFGRSRFSPGGRPGTRRGLQLGSVQGGLLHCLLGCFHCTMDSCFLKNIYLNEWTELLHTEHALPEVYILDSYEPVFS